MSSVGHSCAWSNFVCRVEEFAEEDKDVETKSEPDSAGGSSSGDEDVPKKSVANYPRFK